MHKLTFCFKCDFSNKIDGPAMGSPFALILVNNFKMLYREKWLHEFECD